jgi:class 3 adenylate cyclase
MQESMAELGQQWQEREFHLGAGIGIATGYATLGLIGFKDRVDYAAIGTVSNLAARLCSEAQDGQILIAERECHLVKNFVDTESLGPRSLKGFHRPVMVHRVISLKG